MLFKSTDGELIKEIEDSFSRFGIKSEDNENGASKNAIRFKMFDSIHDSSYVAIAGKKSAGKKVNEVWSEIIDNDLIPKAIETKGAGDTPAGALIVPSEDIDAVSEILRKRGVTPTVYQLFSGYVVAGVNKQNMDSLISRKQNTDTSENKESTPEKSNTDNQSETVEKAGKAPINNNNRQNKTTQKEKSDKFKSNPSLMKKLIVAALLGVGAGTIPFGAKAIFDNIKDVDVTKENIHESAEVSNYLDSIKNGYPEDSELLAAIAQNPELAQEYLEKLADSPVGIDIIKNPSAPKNILDNALKSKDDNKRAAGAENPNADINDLKNLLNDKSNKVRASLAKNPKITKDMMARLAKDDPNVRESLLENDSLTPDILDVISKNAAPTCEFTRKIYANPCQSRETLDYNKNNPDECVRMGVAANKNTSPDTLNDLAKDSTRAVRDNALKNENLPEKAFKDVFQGMNPNDNDKEKNLDRFAALQNKSINPEAIKKALSMSPSKYAVAAAKNPRTPKDHLDGIISRAEGKRGLQSFINDSLDIPNNLTKINELEKSAKKDNTSLSSALRKSLNNSFKNDVYDPHNFAKEFKNDSEDEVKEYKYTKKPKATKIDTDSVNAEKANRSAFERFFAESADGANTDKTQKATELNNAVLKAADAIIDEVMADILPKIEKKSATSQNNVATANNDKTSTTSSPTTSAGGNGAGTTGTGLGAGGKTNIGGSGTNNDALQLFQNACEHIDGLQKLF